MSDGVESTALLARIVVDEDMVGRSTMDRVLVSRRERHPDESLGAYLLFHGYITPSQYDRLKLLGEDALGAESGHDPVLFGEAVVARGLATPDEVAACLRDQAAMAARGDHRNLGQLLIERGVLRVEQVKAILAEKQKTIMVCPTCSERYNVLPGSPAHTQCPADSTPLRAAGGDSSIGIAATLGRKTDSPVGLELGGCRIVELIGRGAMGAVYKARQLRLSRYVAIKTLKADSRDRERVRRLLAEARSVAKLEHPNIVQVYDVGYELGYFYIVMQLLKGQTLEDRLGELGSLPVDEAVEVARGIASGLASAHGQGVVHRDLKPANVMLAGEGIPMLTDFGLAQDPENPEERPGFVVGTPLYMSPEQIEGRRADARSDLYSLGVTLYQLTTGRRPFEGSTVEKIFQRHQKERPRPPRELNPDIPEGFQAVVLKLLAKKPEQRYPDAEAFLRDLDRVGRGAEPEAARDFGNTIRCGFCEAANPSGRTRCSVCGESIGEPERAIEVVEEGDTFSCPACGGANPNEATLCRHCRRTFCRQCRRRLAGAQNVCAVCRARRVRRPRR